MDIYNYFNSKDVAEHCHKLNYQFNSLETAFIIYYCRSISIREKHQLYREIMDTMPETEMPERIKQDYDNITLFQSLKRLIAYESDLIDTMLNGSEGAVYQFGYVDGGTDDNAYSSYERAKEAALREAKRRKTCISYLQLDKEWSITCFYDSNDEISKIRWQGDWRKRDFIEEVFDSIWVYIPTPFKKGDVVHLRNSDWGGYGAEKDSPMVLTSICYWNESEEQIEKHKQSSCTMDMTAYGFWSYSNRKVMDECCHAYQDLEYYRGELIDKSHYIEHDYRLLKAISAYMQGKINEDMFLAANNLIRAENMLKESFPVWDYIDEWYKEAGIADICDKRKLIREYEEKKNERK